MNGKGKDLYILGGERQDFRLNQKFPDSSMCISGDVKSTSKWHASDSRTVQCHLLPMLRLQPISQ